MNGRIIEVEDTFSLAGGLVVTGTRAEYFSEVKMGTRVEILRPDGTKINSQIAGIEMPNFRTAPGEDQKGKIGFLLKDVSKDDVPCGSIISTLD